MDNLVNNGGKCSPRRSLLCSKLILICITISFTCIYAKCHGVENTTVSIYPEGNIMLHYGRPLEIFCIADSNFTSADIELTIGGKIIPTAVVNETTIRLFQEKPEKQVTTYYCHNKITKKSCITRVLVDSTPMAVADFSCKSKNLEVLNCSWTSNELFSVTTDELTFLIHGNAVKSCTATRVNKTRYCTWNTTSVPRYRQMETEYYFHMKSCNQFGCNNQSFTVDHFSIMKPDPPINLRVTKNLINGVHLQWNIPDNMVDLLFCGVDHRIEYQIPKIDNTSYFRRVNASNLPPNNKTYNFLLSDLPYAHTKYEIRIYIKSKAAVNEEFWSDFSYITAHTSSERPRRPPDTAVGAFDQSIHQTERTIYLFWKQLEEYEECGTNFTYKVVVHYKNNYETLIVDKSLSFVVLEKAPFDVIDVYIWSTNDDGSSKNSSYLHIPPKETTEPLKVHSFTKADYENGTYRLSWVGIENIDNYTIFWCEHDSTKICAGRMYFSVLNPNQTMHVIDLPKENRYQFAISANNGSYSSGMVWATCDTSKDAIPMYHGQF